MNYFQLTDEQQEELAKAFASADKVNMIYQALPTNYRVKFSTQNFFKSVDGSFPKRVRMTLIFVKDGEWGWDSDC